MAELIDAPSFETFRDHEGDSFSVDADADVELELATVDTTADTVDGWRRFTLVFRGGGDALDGGTHRLSSDGLDPFDVALSPTPSLDPDADPDADGGGAPVEYEAVFARREPDRVVESDDASTAGGELASTDGTVGLSVDPIIAGVSLFAGNFAPRGFALCDGQQLLISQQQALFSLLGTTYGGNGRTTFGLPDLRGRAPVGAGSGPGLSNRRLGEQGGREMVSLQQSQLAPHAHGADMELPVSNDTGNTTSPDGNALAAQSRGAENPIYTTGSTDGSMAVAGDTAEAGGGQPHENLSPYLALNYVICTEGVFPSRD